MLEALNSSDGQTRFSNLSLEITTTTPAESTTTRRSRPHHHAPGTSAGASRSPSRVSQERRGGTGGFRSFAGAVPELDVGAVVLANQARSVGLLGLRVLDALAHEASSD